MNFLAHAFLSGDDTGLLVGNFIADAVKGRQAALYAPGIARGIRLHRLIDAFTDTHAVVAQTKARLRPKYRKFAPVIADMYYDHFLAARFERFAREPLQAYTERIYVLIDSHFASLPPRVQGFFPHMRQYNWLLSYARLEGVAQALQGMSRRTAFRSGMETAAEELRENYTLYAAEFEAFFPDLIKYVAEVKDQL